nr:hypothetical protein [Tanacetum cinerariifolium]
MGGDRRSMVVANDGRQWRTIVEHRRTIVDYYRTTGQRWLTDSQSASHRPAHIMTDSGHFTVSYTLISSPERSWDISDVDPYEEAALQAIEQVAPPLSPVYLPDLIELDEHVSMYVPNPEYLEYLELPADDIIVEDQPHADDAVPTTLSPGYIADSDPEEDTEEEENADYANEPEEEDPEEEDPKEEESDDNAASEEEPLEGFNDTDPVILEHVTNVGLYIMYVTMSWTDVMDLMWARVSKIPTFILGTVDVVVLSFLLSTYKRTHAYKLQPSAMACQNEVSEMPQTGESRVEPIKEKAVLVVVTTEAKVVEFKLAPYGVENLINDVAQLA